MDKGNATSPLAVGQYVNPVYPWSFPDPYVLKYCGMYYAYATGHAPDGNVFQVLRSRDLVEWVEVAGAMRPLEDDHPFYWAPEAFYDNGKFYLYYSVGNETFMHLRVAVSDKPDRNFVDSGRQLTREEFAIDAHVFVDTDGAKYLFYATDFLEHTHIGTGTVVDRMIDWFTLEGKPSVVTRAKFDWQVYDPKRIEKGGVRWHTVEGPAVIKRKGVYYEMFSGGNWQNTTYGVSFAKSRSVLTPDEWEQFADGERLLPILRTLPEKVVGPGHNSIVRGPNNRELYAVYHRWTDEGRVMAIDRLDFAGERIFVTGATTTPQPAPYQPVKADLSNWDRNDEWSFNDGEAIGSGSMRAKAPVTFLCEVNLRRRGDEHGALGIRIRTEDETLMEFVIDEGSCIVTINSRSKAVAVPHDFDSGEFHLLRIERNPGSLRLNLDSIEIVHEEFHFEGPTILELFAGSPAVFSGLALTEGFEETFELGVFHGWESGTPDNPRVESQQLFLEARSDAAHIERSVSFEDLEFAAAIRLVDSAGSKWSFAMEMVGCARISVDSGRPRIHVGSEHTEEFLALQDLYDWSQFHQFRVTRSKQHVAFYIDDLLIGTHASNGATAAVRVSAAGGLVAVDEIRVTRLDADE